MYSLAILMKYFLKENKIVRFLGGLVTSNIYMMKNNICSITLYSLLYCMVYGTVT